MWGLTGVQKEAVLGARRSLVTVEEVVDELDPRPNAVVLPNWVVTYVSEVPNGAHPSYAHDYSERDNAYYREWDAISKDRNTFSAWLAELREGVPA
jgi:glutaconate CoA-transferase subunit A